MEARQKQYLTMFRRVRSLLTTETIDPAIAGPLKELDGVITRMSEHGVTQETLQRRVRSLTISTADAARAMRRDLMRPARLASRTVIPTLGANGAALQTAMRMPRGTSDYEALVMAARAFANGVEEHAPSFTAAGLPKEFPERMRAAADDLVSRIDARSSEEPRRVAATQGVAAETQRGAAIVRLLDSLVEPTLREDRARLAEWRKAASIRSFVSATGATSEPDTPTVPTTPATPPPAATAAVASTPSNPLTSVTPAPVEPATVTEGPVSRAA